MASSAESAPASAGWGRASGTSTGTALSPQPTARPLRPPSPGEMRKTRTRSAVASAVSRGGGGCRPSGPPWVSAERWQASPSRRASAPHLLVGIAGPFVDQEAVGQGVGGRRTRRGAVLALCLVALGPVALCLVALNRVVLGRVALGPVALGSMALGLDQPPAGRVEGRKERIAREVAMDHGEVETVRQRERLAVDLGAARD